MKKFRSIILIHILTVVVLLCSLCGFSAAGPEKKNFDNTNNSQKAYTPFAAVSYKNVNFTSLSSHKKNNVSFGNLATSKDNLNPMWSKLSEQEKCAYKERILFLILHPYIQDAVNSYYGGVRQYENPEIIFIVPQKLKHIVKIQVTTFVGPHNPPYGEETLTFEIDGSNVQLTDFRHKKED